MTLLRHLLVISKNLGRRIKFLLHEKRYRKQQTLVSEKKSLFPKNQWSYAKNFQNVFFEKIRLYQVSIDFHKTKFL